MVATSRAISAGYKVRSITERIKRYSKLSKASSLDAKSLYSEGIITKQEYERYKDYNPSQTRNILQERINLLESEKQRLISSDILREKKQGFGTKDKEQPYTIITAEGKKYSTPSKEFAEKLLEEKDVVQYKEKGVTFVKRPSTGIEVTPIEKDVRIIQIGDNKDNLQEITIRKKAGEKPLEFERRVQASAEAISRQQESIAVQKEGIIQEKFDLINLNRETFKPQATDMTTGLGTFRLAEPKPLETTTKIKNILRPAIKFGESVTIGTGKLSKELLESPFKLTLAEEGKKYISDRYSKEISKENREILSQTSTYKSFKNIGKGLEIPKSRNIEFNINSESKQINVSNTFKEKIPFIDKLKNPIPSEFQGKGIFKEIAEVKENILNPKTPSFSVPVKTKVSGLFFDKDVQTAGLFWIGAGIASTGGVGTFIVESSITPFFGYQASKTIINPSYTNIGETALLGVPFVRRGAIATGRVLTVPFRNKFPELNSILGEPSPTVEALGRSKSGAVFRGGKRISPKSRIQLRKETFRQAYDPNVTYDKGKVIIRSGKLSRKELSILERQSGKKTEYIGQTKLIKNVRVGSGETVRRVDVLEKPLFQNKPTIFKSTEFQFRPKGVSSTIKDPYKRPPSQVKTPKTLDLRNAKIQVLSKQASFFDFGQGKRIAFQRQSPIRNELININQPKETLTFRKQSVPSLKQQPQQSKGGFRAGMRERLFARLKAKQTPDVVNPILKEQFLKPTPKKQASTFKPVNFFKKGEGVKTAFTASNIAPSLRVASGEKVFGFPDLPTAKAWQKRFGYKNIYKIETDSFVFDIRSYSRLIGNKPITKGGEIVYSKVISESLIGDRLLLPKSTGGKSEIFKSDFIFEKFKREAIPIKDPIKSLPDESNIINLKKGQFRILEPETDLKIKSDITSKSRLRFEPKFRFGIDADLKRDSKVREEVTPIIKIKQTPLLKTEIATRQMQIPEPIQLTKQIPIQEPRITKPKRPTIRTPRKPTQDIFVPILPEPRTPTGRIRPPKPPKVPKPPKTPPKIFSEPKKKIPKNKEIDEYLTADFNKIRTPSLEAVVRGIKGKPYSFKLEQTGLVVRPQQIRRR